MILGVVVAAIAAFEGIRRTAVMPIARVGRKLTQFFEDWFGEEARAGVPRRPGVKEELATLRAEQKRLGEEQAEMNTKLQRVEYHTGNGQEPALRTVVFKQAAAIEEIRKQVTGKDPE